jgi:type IV pilus assembly protein PilX
VIAPCSTAMTHLQPSTPLSVSCAARQQRGVTLIIVLLILVVVTILGIGGAQIALLGERSTRYDRDYLIATQSAEAALMDAEFDIRGPNTLVGNRVASFDQTNLGIFLPNCGNAGTTRGLCQPNADTVRPVWAEVDFLDETVNAPTVAYGTFTGRTFDAGTGGLQPARLPRYIIELIDDKTPGGNAAGTAVPKMYRITAIGFGPRDDIQVVMQIAFRKEKG